MDADDIKKQFGADTAWDVIESILVRYFNERLVTSPRQGMAVAGRQVLRWLAQPHVLEAHRAQFETQLQGIAGPSEEWLTAAQSLGLTRRVATPRPLPWDRGRSAAPPGPAARVRPVGAAVTNGLRG
jgi:hypothetical protein